MTPRRPTARHDGGFTLVELLVVVMVLGVLVGIATPVLLTQQAKARIATARADAAVIRTHLSSHLMDAGGPVEVTSADGAWTVRTEGDPPETSSGPLSGTNEVLRARTDGAGDYCVVVGTGVAGDSAVRVTDRGSAVVDAGSTC